MTDPGFSDGKYDYNPTIGGRYQRHTRGLIGKIWRINDPNTVRIGNCFMKGRLLAGDHFLCVAHSGDCFQTYRYVERYGNGFTVKGMNFGAYGIGDATEVTTLTTEEMEMALTGEMINRVIGDE